VRFLENVAKNRFTGSLDFGYFHSLLPLPKTKQNKPNCEDPNFCNDSFFHGDTVLSVWLREILVISLKHHITHEIQKLESAIDGEKTRLLIG